MNRFIAALIVLACAAAALAVPATASSAKKLHVRHRVTHVAVFRDPRPPLTVNRRSWLDPGPVVPELSEDRYVQANTILNLTPDQTFTGKFGNETLPRRFELPIRQEPTVVFWTPRDF